MPTRNWSLSVQTRFTSGTIAKPHDWLKCLLAVAIGKQIVANSRRRFLTSHELSIPNSGYCCDHSLLRRDAILSIINLNGKINHPHTWKVHGVLFHITSCDCPLGHSYYNCLRHISRWCHMCVSSVMRVLQLFNFQLVQR